MAKIDPEDDEEWKTPLDAEIELNCVGISFT